MAIEIEVKARIDDYEKIRTLLEEKAEYRWTFRKKDSYWYAKDAPPQSHSVIRLRKEKRILPDGTEKSVCFATYKNREIKDGFEINDEREFEVKGETEFEEFLDRVNLNQVPGKLKHGWAFSAGGINVELLEAEGLGRFIELEILSADRREETLTSAKKRLLEFLDSLGVEKTAIESRSYMSLLKELKRD